MPQLTTPSTLATPLPTTTPVAPGRSGGPSPAPPPGRGRATTPGRLRLAAASVLVLAAALLAVSTVGMIALRGQVAVIGDQAAPQAATASDLYVALSDLDAQVARLIMVGDSEDMSSTRIEALLTYQRRNAQIDADLDRALGASTTPRDRARIGRLTDGLTLYRQLAWQAMAVQDEATDQVPGQPPATTLGYYSRATTLLHADLLPQATALRRESSDTLDDSYASQRVTVWWLAGATIVLGAAVVVLLARLQVRLTRRFRRALNPALLGATLLTAGLVVSAAVVSIGAAQRLSDGQRDHFAPYLALTAAQAVGYDAEGDTSRYLISDNRQSVQQDLRAKSQCLIEGGACGSGGDGLPVGLAHVGTSPAGGPAVLARWQAYQRDNEAIAALADSGQVASAVERLTGTARGDAAFDFYYYDTSVSDITAGQSAGFDAAVASARDRLSGWTAIPGALMGVAMLLVLLGVWPRLNEYR